MDTAINARMVADAAPVLKKRLKVLDYDVQCAIERAANLKLEVLALIKAAEVDIGLIGDAIGWFGRIDAGLGEAARGLQGLHAASHEALERLAPTEERSGPGDKTPPPKP